MRHARNIEELIDRQVKLWEVKRALARLGGRPARDALVHLDEGPWITLSRQRGSGAGALAQHLAGRLGWQVFDREIMDILARQTHISERMLAGLDEHAVSKVREVLSHFFLPKVEDQVAFLAEVTRVILTLAHQGKAIILGRGANHFLDPRYGLRVRAVAPLAVRAAAIAKSDGVSAAEAERRAQAYESEQRAFIRQVFGREIDDPLAYDLVLNLGALDLQAAAGTVLSALRLKLKAAKDERAAVGGGKQSRRAK